MVIFEIVSDCLLSVFCLIARHFAVTLKLLFLLLQYRSCEGLVVLQFQTFLYVVLNDDFQEFLFVG